MEEMPSTSRSKKEMSIASSKKTRLSKLRKFGSGIHKEVE